MMIKLLQILRPKVGVKVVRRASLLVAALGTTTAISVSMATTASAQCMEYGMGFTNLRIQEFGTTGTYWNSVLNLANADWNRSGAGTALSQTYSSSGGRYTASRFGTSVNGRYTPTGTKGVNRTFLIQINAESIEKYAPKSVNTDFTHWNRVVTIHEIGHALSLPDNPNDKPSNQYSIMTNPPTNFYFIGGFDDWGYYSLPTSWDASQVRRCN